ncbi:uncharacterized protein F13E9.13, mitochondrial [Rhodnius prolixus]|uniref:uncharacterized protein F13E9.13, mitochondrial n=1 Tax=Rhodnius prolixus TaxID=13249 RepID=UPI003D18C2CD
MNKLKALFNNRIIGMIHVGALPGSPKFEGSIDRLVDKACEEAELYKICQVGGIMVENMHDIPYVQSKYFGPEVTATLTKVCWEIKRTLDSRIPCGLQILAGGNIEALAVAKICDYQFVRAEGFIYSHIADEGFMDANAGHLLRYRKYLNAENVLIFTDIKKKHCSHTITSDLTISDVAKAAEFFLSDGLVLTGTRTGQPASTSDLEKVKEATNLPVLIGSGITVDNVECYSQADAFIVGSYFKKDGRWENDVSKDNVMKLMEKVSKM